MQTVDMTSRRSPNFLYKLKIVITFFQLGNAIVFLGNITWPTLFQDFLTVFTIFNFNFIPWHSIGCAVGLNFYEKVLVTGLLPFVAFSLLFLFFFLPMKFMDKRDFSDDRVMP